MSAYASGLKVPPQVEAGKGITISAPGNGEATLYVAGPGVAIKKKVQLGQAIQLSSDDLKNAGLYFVSLDGSGSATFFVTAGPVSSIAFLARPSRVPADRPDVIAGTAFVFDKYQNLVLQPQPVKFDLEANGQNTSRTVTTKDGVAYARFNSSKKEAPAEFVASSGGASVRRVVQEVASDPCNIRMHAQPDAKGILVQTDPIRDCAGNPVPDGTIVTFISIDNQGKNTVDARIKRGIAQAQLPPSDRCHPIRRRRSGHGQRNTLGRWKVKQATQILLALAFAVLMIAFQATSAPAHVIAAGTPVISIDVQSAGPRQVEDTTEQAVARDYSAAWRTMAEALNQNRNELIATNFVGTAADKLVSSIDQQKRTGLHQRFIDKGHSVQAVFYSPEGSAMELHDVAHLQIELLDGDKLIYSEDTTVQYVVLMTAAENSWKVRVLQAVPSF